MQTEKYKHWKVYSICFGPFIVYIGITTHSLEKRLKEHIKTKSEIGGLLRKTTHPPFIIELESLSGTRKQAEEREHDYIVTGLRLGHPLTNISHIPSCSEEYKIFLYENDVWDYEDIQESYEQFLTSAGW